MKGICRIAWILPLAFAAFYQCSSEPTPKEKMFFIQRKIENKDSPKLLAVTWVDDEVSGVTGCEIFTDQNLIDEVLKTTVNPKIHVAADDEIHEILRECTEVPVRKKRYAIYRRYSTRRDRRRYGRNRKVTTENGTENEGTATNNYEETTENNYEETTENNNEEITTEGYSGVPVILPGTKWCGAGNVATDYDDLGFNEYTDKCCRAHDNCDDVMAPGETKYNLTNTSLFSKLICRCDDEFYECLQKINSVTSNTLGSTYFNVLLRECYKFDHPWGNCKNYRTLLKITCKEYERDTTSPKVWQWQKARWYKTLPIPGPLTITAEF